MQNEPTAIQREEYRAFINNIVAVIHEIQPYVQKSNVPWIEDESGRFQDPKYTAAVAALNSTVTALVDLRGQLDSEWLSAHLERTQRAQTPLWSSLQAHLERKGEV